MNPVLVASDNAADVEVVRRLLRQEGYGSERSLDPKRLAADFERWRPQVLVLAFKTLEAAERHCLALYRQSRLATDLPHRTLVLCHIDATREAYERCRAGAFDDYVQFWPLTHDAMNLPKAVHLALRALDGQLHAVALGQVAAQAQRIAELEALLDAQLATGLRHADALAQAGEAAQAGIGAALAGLGHDILDTGLDDAVAVRDGAQVRRVLDCVDRQVVKPAIGRVQQAITPVRAWMDGLKEGLAAPVDAARAITRETQRLRQRILVVDDDRFVARALRQVMTGAGYDVRCAADAAEAMQLMREGVPDMVLMDVGLPDISGIELVRQVKASPTLSRARVLMLTGRSEKSVIVESMAAGASDFVVKPFDRELLLKKVGRLLCGEAAAVS